MHNPTTVEATIQAVGERAMRQAIANTSNSEHADTMYLYNKMVDRGQPAITTGLDNWNRDTSGNTEVIALNNAISTLITDALVIMAIVAVRHEQRMS